MKTGFNTLFEDILKRYQQINANTLNENIPERYQQGGYKLGDRVIFRKDWQKHDFFKYKGQSFIDLVKSCSDNGFDLNLRVSAVKSIYPSTSQNYRGGTESPDHIYVDVIVEYAPGLYRTPMTVPIEVLQLMDDGINTGPVPDSIKRKSKVHGPENIKAKGAEGFDVNYATKNTDLKFVTKSQDDSKPSRGWKVLPTK